LYASASHNSEGLHLRILEDVLEIGYDFDNSPAPQFESWPRPCADDLGGEFSIPIIPQDPFFLEYLSAIVRTNQGNNLFQYVIDLVLKHDLQTLGELLPYTKRSYMVP
jgi:hypothetical protein